MKAKRTKLFLVEIETQNKTPELNYLPKTRVIIPVNAINGDKALDKVRNTHWGSEYPVYNVESVKECDWLFKPIL
jgi:hypothetical protein